jgi:phosphatidylinositol 4-kinase
LPEIEALFALCKAAPLVTNKEIAAQLLPQLTSYLPEAHLQMLMPPLTSPDLEPSPWEPLTYNLTTAVLALSLNHSFLRKHTQSSIDRYISSWAEAAHALGSERLDPEEDDDDSASEPIARMVKMAVSMLGFLGAAAEFARFWAPLDRIRVIQMLREALSERFMIALETALSIMRNSRQSEALAPWRLYAKRYAASGRPLGAMLLRQEFMQLMVTCTALYIIPHEDLEKHDIIDILLEAKTAPRLAPGAQDVPVDDLAEIAASELQLLDEGSDYLKLGSAWQQRLASAVKASALKCFLICTIMDEEVADEDVLLNWLEGIMSDQVQIADEQLASVVFKSMAILAKSSASIATNMARGLPRILVQGGLDSRTASVAAQCLATVLRKLPQDATITTLYSLGNILSVPSTAPDRTINGSPLLDSAPNSRPKTNGDFYAEHSAASVISFGPSEGEESHIVYNTIVEALVCIASTCKEEKIVALVLNILTQKLRRISLEVDTKIVTETAILGEHAAPNDLKAILRIYSRLCHDALMNDNVAMLDAIRRARLYLSHTIKRGSDNFELYVLYLMSSLVSQGDAHERKHSEHAADVELAAQEIAQLLQPIAALTLENAQSEDAVKDVEIEGLVTLQRDAWFNAVVHGFTATSPLGRRYRREMRVLAQYSQPLIAEDRTDQLESDIELNTTLRRGKNDTNLSYLRKHLAEVIPSCESDIRTLGYSECVFLTAAYLVESLRASAGDCSHVLTYFLDPRLKSGEMGNCMQAIARSVVGIYLNRTATGQIQLFTSPFVAQQLALFFAGICHRIVEVQRVAITCAEQIIAQVPSALCQKSSLFALFELLTIMWTSCLEQETDEYEWTSKHHSVRGNCTVELSDNYEFRRKTMIEFHKCAKDWLLRVLEIAPLDIKGLIQTYLSEYEDDGAYGHISLGRSFALEMGSVIPSTDLRLGAIENKAVGINTASDFVAQYTTRQEYRFVGGIRDDDQEWVRSGADGDPLMRQDSRFDKTLEDAGDLLADIESRTLNHKVVPIAELRDALRRAGALLCRTQKDQGAIVQHLVGIPFSVFTKQSIKLGISLWMGVIKENARMEFRIFVEIARNWEETVRKRRGLFDHRLHHYDPFNIKQEFAPSDRALIVNRQHGAIDMIAPHLRVAQFLSSHFNATRLGSPYIQRIYYRLMTITLDALAETKSHPLAREAHFHIILLGLRILRFGIGLDITILWRLKDRLLTAALAWFANPPRWSYGGNRLQIKAEKHLLDDVQVALAKVDRIGHDSTGSLKSLSQKVALLQILLSNEVTRLTVWLFPLDNERKHHLRPGHHHHASISDPTLLQAVRTAWTENPSLAIQFCQRFESQAVNNDVRFLLINFPEKALNEPNAVELLLGSSMPSDVSFQLRFLLYWAPVNPITAVTYFLPAYGNHPLIIQYANRALDSHSVDVTFFYVPQIVQALRYDVLGYVERYIIEAAKFSQLFAHQIIWNMKANAFKDEDSQIVSLASLNFSDQHLQKQPDGMKPTLDKVMERLIASFSSQDKLFYEREFSFFNEVTDISGKLKPYIKRPKPEKKAKIEEELRKIQVEVGVYLPSNPDGVVVGIDRKSGKPLQSHAKAPYMATFRIKREKGGGVEDDEELIEANGNAGKRLTYETWQSAIFKVGDDCRQDVLALQLIAAFRGIFHNVGLDVYVFPYRVTATAPGCGVIDVLPNSISRDMLGREAVNGLYDYFVSKYGGEDSIRFQEARNNFVKSMAAYSVISYLLQFKDRHNGNIMIDDAGHILHIDFGFCFDIVPGGVKFEQAPFKLTTEMVAVMGGPHAQAYQWFEEMCIKAFLASRPYCEHLAHMVITMLDSGLPCFKPQTMQNFRNRFALDKSEREAADVMRGLIKKSYSSLTTKGYDQFQLLTNGIPY